LLLLLLLLLLLMGACPRERMSALQVWMAL